MDGKDRTGILLIGHGSRLPHNKEVMMAQADNLRRLGYRDVYVGFNEMSSPLIEDVLIQMAADGVDRVMAIPFFIASGLHVVRDIPAKLGIPEGSSEGRILIGDRTLDVLYETPFGEDTGLTEVISERVTDLKVKEGRFGIMVIGHGSQLPYNSDVVNANADRLMRKGYAHVYVGFNEFNEPSIEDSLDSMLNDGMDEIAVVPMFIASGGHIGEEIPEKLGIPAHSGYGVVEHEGRDVTIRLLDPIGSDSRLCTMLDKKIKKRLDGL